MDQRTVSAFFALLRSAIFDKALSEEEKELFSEDMLPAMASLAAKQDLAHLLALGLEKNRFPKTPNFDTKKQILKAVYRYERLRYEYQLLSATLEEAEIPFLPLKGAVIRKLYPEPYLRTSCDVDVLVHKEDLEQAISCLTEKQKYTETDRTTHDVTFSTPRGIHIELHFDLVEEGRANNAIDVLRSVWESASLCENSQYCYQMSDAFFYFYHIAHMAKHFENGGCGVRPFMDLYLLNHMKNADIASREVLLQKGELSEFAAACCSLSNVWFEGKEAAKLDRQMEEFLFRGGIYGSTDNRVALQQTKRGGRFGYLLSRIFIPYDKLKRYYPILEKHRWLTPVMQVRRWFMLFRPDVAKRTENELKTNRRLKRDKALEMNEFLNNVGL